MTLRSLLSLLLICALIPWGTPAAASSDSGKPNIIFIMVDDMGPYDLGSYGQDVIQTPHLDRMAAEGMRFTQAYAGASVCAPARSVLMTGQHTGRTRVRGNMGMTGGDLDHNNRHRIPLEPEDITVGQVLQSAGYVTGMTGKWGLGQPGSTGEPNFKGFNEWFGYLNQNRAHNHYPEYIWHNLDKYVLEGNHDGRETQYTHDLFTEFALDFIKKHHERPFFLYLPYCVPHAGFQIPDQAPYADKPWTEQEKIYAAMLTRMDRDVGTMFDLLKQLGIDNNTIVFFTSDNGAAHRYDDRFDSNGILRGRKGDLYEGGLRAPLIVRWPGRIEAGSVTELPWYFADFLPVAADLAGVSSPGKVDGVSFLPTLLGKEQNLHDRKLYWEQYQRGFEQAVRWGPWKGIRRGAYGDSFELYNLEEDPSETTDVSAKYPSVVNHIGTYMDTAHTPTPYWFR